MRDVKIRFRNLITNLNYNQIQLTTPKFNIGKLVPWMHLNMPSVVKQLEPLGWDLTDDKTWLETVFISETLKWYGNKVAVFITDSFMDYQLSTSFYDSKVSEEFWSVFDIQAHISVLVDSTIFMTPDNLDDIYIALNWKRKYSLLDLSGYDEDDTLLPHLQGTWGFLEADENTQWTNWNKIQANIRNI